MTPSVDVVSRWFVCSIRDGEIETMKLMDSTLLVHLPKALLEEIKETAKSEGFSAGDFARQSLKRNLAIYAAQREALRFVPKPSLGF